MGASVPRTMGAARRVPAPLAALVIGAALAVSRVALQPMIGGQSAFFMAAPAMIVAAFLGGLWPTLAVGALAFAVGEWALVSAGQPALGPVGIIIYLGFVAVFGAAGEMRQRGLRRAAKDAEQLAEMQQRLVQVARLNAMGEMAGTLAHELNQPLTAISSYAGAAQMLAQRHKALDSEIGDLLKKISDQAVRAREIIGRIRGHVSGAELDLQPARLSRMVEEAIAAATVGAGAPGLAIRFDFEAAADEVLADRTQFQQVVVNLVRNAAEAMRGGARPTLTIGSRKLEDGLVEAFVADNGPGLDPELAQRLFEPFVTGKPDGMGIGLAVSRNIIEAHGGRIWAESAPQGGAVFRFTLRRIAAEIPA